MMGLIREVTQVLRKKWADLRGLYARGGGGGGSLWTEKYGIHVGYYD